jgi:phasin family protein
MSQAPEQFVQLSKSSIQAALTLADITLQSAERLMDIQLKSGKDALDHGLRNAKALSDVKNVQDLIALQSTATQPSIEKALSYSRSVYEVASDAQTRINKVIEARISELSGEMIAAMDKAVKSAPAGSETALAAFKSAIAATNNVYDSMTRAAHQASDRAANKVAGTTTKPTKKKAH